MDGHAPIDIPHSHTFPAHHHDHGPTEGWRYTLAIGLNLAVIAVQAAVGFRFHSTALLADAGHNASDVAGLLLAAGAAWLMARGPSGARTYGFGKAGILAAFLNSLLLVFACVFLAYEAVTGLVAPSHTPPPGVAVMLAALVAIVANIGSGALLMGGHPDDINRKAAVLHLFADGGISVGVLVAGALIQWTGLYWIDPVASLLIVGVILASTWRLLFQSLNMALDSVPPGYDTDAIRHWLETQPTVAEVHDLHVWPLGPTLVALTAHIVAPEGHQNDLLREISHGLHRHFGIGHATIQIEKAPQHSCDELHP